MMRPVVNPISQPLLTDTVVLRLARSVFPFDILFSDTSMLLTDGNVKFDFPIRTNGNLYYLVFKHRNTLESGSASPVLINYNLTYDYTTMDSKAYGNNLKNLGDGNFAIYSGDVDQNGIISTSDFILIENGTQLFYTGYLNEDLPGDAIIESSDFSLVENNLGRIISRP